MLRPPLPLRRSPKTFAWYEATLLESTPDGASRTNGPNLRDKSPKVSYYRVSEQSELGRPWEVLTLREVRGYIRRSHAVMMSATFAVLYALGAMTLGGMLILTPLGGGYQFLILWGNALGIGPWNYPALIVTAPWGYVELPFFATFAMIVVSIGVALGMAVAVLLGISLVRARRNVAGRATSVGSIAGLTPMMITLVTVGACCSTSAASIAGIGLVAGASGATVGSLLFANWYLGVFQMVIVWLALFAQEIVLRVYGGILGLRGEVDPAPAPLEPFGRRLLLGGLLRAALLVGGITWSLTTLAEWTTTAPGSASAGIWFHWIVQQQVPGFLAILAGLFPRGTYAVLVPRSRSMGAIALRVVLLVAGASLAIGTPPPLAGWGVEGFGNELLAVLGVPRAWGAITPVLGPGAALYFRWGFELLLTGGFAIAAAVRPTRAFSLWAPLAAGARGVPRSVPASRPIRATPGVRTPATTGDRMTPPDAGPSALLARDSP